MADQTLFWIAFNAFVVLMLFLDLKVFHRKSHVIEFREALGWSAFWVGLAVAFAVGIFFFWPDPSQRGEKTIEFVTGYLIEESLSVDNLFVFLLIFSYFKVPRLYQHKVLFWGIIGALVMRLAFILAGVVLINRFHWIIYVFGAFLIYTGFKLFRQEESEIHPEKNPLLRLFRRFYPVTKRYYNGHFFIRKRGVWIATPLFLVLIVVETTDVLFAADSIPAILAITRDPFIVYTSNVFAILGLRSVYFALAGMMEIFHYLHYGLAVILIFIGAKMMMAEIYKVPIGAALGVVAGVLAISIIMSVIKPHKKARLPKLNGETE
ncbi:MAG: TerC family protein [Terriglobales bacterium]